MDWQYPALIHSEEGILPDVYALTLKCLTWIRLKPLHHGEGMLSLPVANLQRVFEKELVVPSPCFNDVVLVFKRVLGYENLAETWLQHCGTSALGTSTRKTSKLWDQLLYGFALFRMQVMGEAHIRIRHMLIEI